MRLADVLATMTGGNLDFPTFGWGLSLRPPFPFCRVRDKTGFPRLRAGTFIEAASIGIMQRLHGISPPSGGDFH